MICADRLGSWPTWAQYLHYVLTAFDLVGFSAWDGRGRPNPFVSRAPRHGLCMADVMDMLTGPEGRRLPLR